jgi:hypothetical protein
MAKVVAIEFSLACSNPSSLIVLLVLFHYKGLSLLMFSEATKAELKFCKAVSLVS